MIRFYREYPGLVEKVPQAVAQLPEQEANEKVPQAVAHVTDLSVLEKLQKLVEKIPWGQNFLLIEKVKDLSSRLWYMQKTIENGWSRDVLQTMIKSKAHERQGKAVTNFEVHLPAPQSDLAQQALKDPYIFDFLCRDADDDCVRFYITKYHSSSTDECILPNRYSWSYRCICANLCASLQNNTLYTLLYLRA